MAHLSFHGGTGGVTGANYLLEEDTTKIIVDCGLFQGGKFAEDENKKAFAYDPRSLDACLITHAHADHIGRLPKLYHDGFRGAIYATAPTCDLSAVMFEDALHIMEHEREENHERLYGPEDVAGVLELFRPIEYGIPFKVGGFTVTARDTAHILGSCMFEVEASSSKIVFTGDLGNTPTPLLKSIYPLQETDYMVMESVYGDRLHESAEGRKKTLERVIEDTVTAGGAIIIPVFALERTQEVLAELNELIEHNRIPRIPVFLDSPLAINATKVFQKYNHLFNENAQQAIREHDELFSFPGLTFCLTREDSKKINEIPSPKIILAGNPHGDGSRIAHHFARYLPDPKNTVLFVGYARVSSMGRNLVDGAHSIRIFDRNIPVNAHIVNISGYSAHADQNQLLNFVRGIKKPVVKIFVTMGEAASSETLARLIRDTIGIHAETPKLDDTVELGEAVTVETNN